jgi:hypothetical protein
MLSISPWYSSDGENVGRFQRTNAAGSKFHPCLVPGTLERPLEHRIEYHFPMRKLAIERRPQFNSPEVFLAAVF